MMTPLEWAAFKKSCPNTPEFARLILEVDQLRARNEELEKNNRNYESIRKGVERAMADWKDTSTRAGDRCSARDDCG